MIKFSRHSKQRMKLYNLSEYNILEVINRGDKIFLNDEKISFIASLDNYNYPIKKGCKMKVNYDNEVDALYIQISDEEPEGVIEVKEGLNIDITKDGKIVGIELLDASKKTSLKSFFSYEISPDAFGKAS